ncbi:MAG TPA: FAD binding domain-containing protein [Thermoanaerobaculia bacterium]
MKNFVLLPARSLEEAARAAARPHTELKAGGVDLIDRMKEGIDAPERVVSIAHLPGLDQIQMGSPAKIGALATLASIAHHADIQKTYPALAAAADGAATPQIRNMATLGGNICQRPRCWYYRLSEFDCRKNGGKDCFAKDGENRFHAIFDTDLLCVCVHPSATAVVLTAYRADFEIVSPAGKKKISVDELFLRPTKDATKENRLAPGEIIQTVLLPAPGAGARSAYRKLKEKESFDWPLVEACVAADLDGGRIRESRVVLGHVASVPWRSKEAEAVLAGQSPSPELFRKAADAAVAGAKPLAQNGFKVRLARVTLERTLRDAFG